VVRLGPSFRRRESGLLSSREYSHTFNIPAGIICHTSSDMPAPSPEQEIEQLVQEQIRVFTHPKKLDDRDILEFHLRHYRIRQLRQEVHRIARSEYIALGPSAE